MKQFFKITLATMLGIFLTSIIGFILFLGFISMLAPADKNAAKLEPHSVYELKLSGSLVERSEDDPFSGLSRELFSAQQISEIGLDDVLANIQKAKTNPNIDGIFLNGGLLDAQMASMKEIRDALIDFKQSGKFLIAYADQYEQSNYYLASVADRILLNPQGIVEWKGISAQLTFFKNTLDKLGIDVQVVRVGTYKAAVEPFIYTEMSDANRKQVNSYIQSVWSTLKQGVSESRHISLENLDAFADEMLMLEPAEKLQAYGLIDTLVYSDQIQGILDSIGTPVKLISHARMNNVEAEQKYERQKIAMIYASGEIDGVGSGGISSNELLKTIEEVKENDQVKAVVFRVNSPGGSAFGSEQIWRSLGLLKEKKSLVVSMGDYAASGGYYISCMADKIVAQPNTLTGSIGIFGMIPDISGLNKKLGITHEVVNTHKMSDAPNLNRAFTPAERNLMQAYVERGYALFVNRCAEGRGMKDAQIREIAEGRVWTGEQALNIGLVDTLGNLNDAIEIAAKLADISSYEVIRFPEKEDFATRFMKSFEDDMETRVAKIFLGDEYATWSKIRSVKAMKGLQARLPFFIEQ